MSTAAVVNVSGTQGASPQAMLTATHVEQLAFMFGSMQVAKLIPFDDNPEYIMYARAAYVIAQLACLLINYYCTFRVRTRCCVGKRGRWTDTPFCPFPPSGKEGQRFDCAQIRGAQEPNGKH